MLHSREPTSPEALSVGRPRIRVPERASRDSRSDGSLCINPRDHSMENLQFIHSSLDYTHAQTISTLSIHTYSILLEVNPAAATHNTHSYKEAVKVLTRA